jgi:hypothetical protein
MPFLIVLFTVALGLCVVGLVVISLWWSWLFLAAIFESVRDDWRLRKPKREPRPGDYRSTAAPNPPPASRLTQRTRAAGSGEQG